MSRFFRRKKKEEKTAEPKPEEEPAAVVEEEAAPEPPEDAPVESEVAEPVPEGRGDTIPYHDSIQDRLVYMLNDSKMADGLEGTHEFTLEFMAMGERFWIAKAPLGEIETKVGKAADELAPLVSKSLLFRNLNTRPPWSPIPLVLKTLVGHTDIVMAVSITSNGKLAISGSRDRTCILWDLTNGRVINMLSKHTNNVNTVSITPNGATAISGSSDRTCILWDLETGKALKTLTGHTSYVYSY